MSNDVEAVVLHRSLHTISRKDIDPDALKVLYRLYRNGFKAYLVGGAIRDLLLGKSPKDFDIATDARPGQIKKLFANCFLIGKRFRLAHIRFRGGKIIEVATFRKDPDESDDENSDKNNTFGSPVEDAFRRDITINALYYDISTFSVIDYVGGLNDISQNKICVIGDPAQRYAEDPVRMWRVLRYAVKHGFFIEQGTANAIEDHRHLLAKCSGSRLYEELNKDIISGYSREILYKMVSFSMLSIILGSIGKVIEDNHDIRKEVFRNLNILDESISRGEAPSLAISYSMILWPWSCYIIKEKKQLYKDMMSLLTDELSVSNMAIIIPKAMKANVLHAHEIFWRMINAMQTGKIRWSIQKKASYKDASALYSLITTGRLRQGEDVFAKDFTEKYPAETGMKKFHNRRRRRFRGHKSNEAKVYES